MPTHTIAAKKTALLLENFFKMCQVAKIFRNTHTHTHTHIHAYIHTYIHTYIRIYIHISRVVK